MVCDEIFGLGMDDEAVKNSVVLTKLACEM